MSDDVTTFDGAKVDDWASRITACWRQSVEAIIATGRLIAEAKAALEHGEYLLLVQERLPFSARTAQRLVAVAADPRLTNTTHASLLPASWMTLYELTRLDDDTFDARVVDGTINPDMDRRVIEQVVKRQNRETRERVLGGIQCSMPIKKYGLIYIDIPRRFNVHSRDTGLDRAPENHYPTMTFEQTLALPVSDLAAPDCILVFWSTAASLIDDIEIMTEWGFITLRPRITNGKLVRDGDNKLVNPIEGGRYCSMQVWDKVKMGLGYWFRDRHEFIIVAARGKVVAPAQGTQDQSLFAEEKGEHSAKPDRVAAMIDRLWPTIPKIEMFRRGPSRPGWDAWGNESEPEAQRDDTALDAAPAPPQNSSAWQSPLADDPMLDITEFLRRTEKTDARTTT